MIADWYENGFDIEHDYREEVLIKPKTRIFVPARINLRAIVESERAIETNEDDIFYDVDDREFPSLFWKENLVSSNNNVYIFETNYCTESDEILPISYLKQIPERLTKNFLKKAPPKIHELADKLVGTETDTKKILRKFNRFVYENEEYKTPTTGKSIKKLLKEYEKEGHFYGNCKEARDFYSALCNSKGLPIKKSIGKCLEPGAHVWTDVFVPTNKGYRLFPVDPITDYFGQLDKKLHIFFEIAPNIGIIDKTLDFITRNDYKLKLKIEHIG